MIRSLDLAFHEFGAPIDSISRYRRPCRRRSCRERRGLIVADAYGAALVRQAPEHRLPSATRRMVTLRFAQLAAHRLHGLGDPTFATVVE